MKLSLLKNGNIGGYMVRICSNEKIERILKTIRRYIYGRNNGTEDITNIHTEYITEEYDDAVYNPLNLKERITNLIKENEKYFIYEVMRTTSDAILYDNYSDMERLKTRGYCQRIAIEIFEKYGIFLYASDLSDYIHAPRPVGRELYVLIEKYGLEKVTEEIAIYLKDNYPDKFGISIVAIQ